MTEPIKNNDSLTSVLNELQKYFLFVIIGFTLILIVFYFMFQERISQFIWLKILFATIIALFVLAYLLFRTILAKIKVEIKDLYNSKQEVVEKLEDLQELYITKEASLQELQGLNYAIDNAALFVKLSHEGTVLHISKKFSKLLGLHKKDQSLPLEEMLSIDEKEQRAIQELRIGKRRTIWMGEVQVTSKLDEKLWLEMSIIPMNKIKNNERILILCTDITKRIESQKEINDLNEKRFLEEVNQQKEQASQIVEAQEEERKRIAKDIHDGIGQMLTALKFNIESIDSSKMVVTSQKVKILRELLRNLIKEVRTVTFNLTPPELSDYGIVATLNKLASRLSALTEKKVFFENRTDFNGRFDSLVETNLYRVVQEAVNNALKYAKSNYILIALSHSKDILSIIIDDDGIGFDMEKVGKTNKESGMGLFFMKERISYINGRVFINSVKERGTRITINIKLPKS